MEFAGSSTLSNRQYLDGLILPPLAVTPVSSPLQANPWQVSAASSIVFVDAGVEDYQSLVAGVQPGTEVRLLDSTQDAIDQITQTLLGRTGISNIQILSHGESGGLRLGQDWLTLHTLDRYASQIQSWSQALTEDADILLLGCNVGQGDLGQAFLQQLSQLTGADIAGSINLTGSADLEGDWTLEVNTGEIGAAIAFRGAALAHYQGTLDVDLLSQVPNAPGNSLVSDATGIKSSNSSISGDGRYVVFTSTADNVVPNDANGSEDVFLYDRDLKTTTLVSRTSTGASGNGDSTNGVISRDGSHVAFASFANNLVNDDTNATKDVFVWERSTGIITLVSQGIGGVAGNQASDNPVLTNDGSRIAFISQASNLTAVTDNNGVEDIFVRDWKATTPLTTLVSRNSAGTIGNRASSNVSISGDGLFVAFTSFANNLALGDTNNNQDVFIRGLAPVNPLDPANPLANNTLLISQNDDLTIGDGASSNAVISNDGTFVAFVSSGSNLVAGNTTNPGLTDTNGVSDVFVRDWVNGKTVLVSINSSKTATGDPTGTFGAAGSGNPVISFDGKYIAFTSYSKDLTANNDANNTQDVFSRDWRDASSVTTLVSYNTVTLDSGNAKSYAPVISSDGAYIAFASDASDLLSVFTSDTNNVQDVFVWQRSNDTTRLISRNTAGTLGDGASYNPVIGSDVNGTYVAFVSEAKNLPPSETDLNGQPDLFLRNVGANETALISKRDATSSTPATGAGNSTASVGNSVSTDGRYVVFTSTVSNLVDNDSNGIVQDVFWRDRQTGQTSLVSRSKTGFGSGNQASTNPVISGDGRYVAFVSEASDLVTTDTNGRQDVFVWDSSDNSMLLVSRSMAGDGGNGNSFNPVMSSDGRYIAFVSAASDLIASDQNNAQDVFIWDRNTPTTVALVSRDPSNAAGNGDSSNPTISNDGSVVAFTSNATTLIANDDNNQSDVFVWQRQGASITSGTVKLVSRNTAGTIGNNASFNSAVSGDGKYVAFGSAASNLFGNDNNAKQDIFINELFTGKTDLVSINASGTASGSTTGAVEGLGSVSPAISNTGQYVAFVSDAVDIVTNDNNGVRDIFVWNRLTSQNILVSVNKDGLGSGDNATPDPFLTFGGSSNPVISGDGQVVAFTSYSSDLVANDTNNAQDVFVRNLNKSTVNLVSRSQTSTSGNREALTPALSSDGSYAVFTSAASNLVSADFNSGSDVFGDTVMIVLPTVTFDVVPPNVVEGNNPASTTPYNFEVTLSKSSTDIITVPFVIADVSTTAGNDYVAPTSTTLTFAPGQTKQTLAIAVKGDTQVELDETFTVTLGTPTNATLGIQTTATGRILNDDQAIINFSQPTFSIQEGASGKQDLNFVVTLSQPTPQAVTVNYSTADGIAAVDSSNAKAIDGDYDITTGSLTFAPNATVQTLVVKVNGDTKFEPDQTFTLNLSAPTNAALGTTATATGTILNDDPAPTLSLASFSAVEGNSGTTDFPFTITLSQAIDQDVVVDYTTVDGTATGGSDYLQSTGQVTIVAGATTSTVTVTVNGDSTPEPNETFTLQLANPTIGTLTNTTATGTILNDDTLINFDQPTYSITETNSGTQDLLFTVTLSQASTQQVSVNYSTVDGTAKTTDSDYDITTGSLTFAPNTTVQTLVVKVNGDTKFEPDQTFTLNLSAPTNAALGTTATATGTILNDDPAPTLSLAGFSAVEGNSGTTDFPFIITLSQAIDQDVVVDYTTVDGTATASGDYLPTTGQVTIVAGTTTSTVTVTVNGDSTPEPNEAFTLQLANPTIGTLSNNTATGTILNDDTLINFSQPTYSITETNSGTQDLLFTVTLSQASTQQVTVNYSTVDGTAKTTDSDYQGSTGSLTFAPNATVQTLVVKVNGDTKFEPDQTFTLNLATPTNAALGTTTTATGTILNDDLAPTLSLAGFSAVEGNSGTTDFPFIITLSQAIDQDVVVDYTTVDGTATGGSDYLQSTGQVTIVAGTTTSTVTVTVNGDSTPEPNEAFTLQLANPTIGTLSNNTATGTILNDDTLINFDQPTYSLSEGNSGTQDLLFTVTLSQASTQQVTVNYSTVDGTAKTTDSDYQGNTGSLTFAPNATAQTLVVKVNGDTKFEPDQTFTLNLSAPTNAALGTTATATGTILNDDPAPTLSLAGFSAVEGNSGTTDFPFIITLSQAIDQDVVVDYTTVDGTATGGSDYLQSTGQVTIVAGTTTSTVTVTVNGDSTPEPNEAFTLQLANPTIGTLSNNTATGTILNDDTLINFSQPTYSLSEGNSGTQDLLFTVTLSEASTQQVTVNYSTVDGTAKTTDSDYQGNTGSLTFAPNATAQTLVVKVNGDTKFEPDQTFTLNLSAPTNAALGTTATATGTILNDDPAPTLSLAGFSAVEGNSGTTDFPFIITLSQAIDQDVVVDYTTVDGTATASGDYLPTTGQVTIVAGTTTSTVTVTVNGDSTPEPNETFTLQLANPTIGTLSNNTATGTILNDDTLINFSQPTYSLSEGNSGTQDLLFTVTLSQASTQQVTVNYSTVDGTAKTTDSDYQGSTGSLTFAPNTTAQTLVVKVNGDTTFEADQTFTLNLATPTNAALGTTATATGTILNDDPAPTLSLAGFSAVEGNSGTTDFPFVITLSQAIDQDVVVDYTTVDGTATASGDYLPTTGQVTIVAGTTTSTVTVTVNGDSTPEPNETFTLQLANPTIGTLTNTTATGTILNDDTLINFDQPTYSITETNSGTQDLLFTVTLSQASTQQVTVNYSTADGTAKTTDSDYQGSTGSLTFAPNTTVQTLVVKVNGDTKFESDETFTLNLATPTNAALGTTATATGTIVNNDSAIVPIVSITSTVASRSEGDSGITLPYDFKIDLSQASDQPVIITYSTADATAQAGSDYIAVLAKTVTFAPGETSKLITVDITGDNVYEGDETFNVNLISASGATLSSTNSGATGAIADDDPLPFLVFNGIAKPEGNAGTTDFDFDFTLSGPSSQPITVTYTTADGTAKVSDNDYQTLSSTLTFAPGETTQKVTVKVNGDAAVENNETFTLRILNTSAGVLVGNSSALATIGNDDTLVNQPTLSITPLEAGQAEGNNGKTDFTFVVALTPNNSQQPVTVTYTTVDNTATVTDTDYDQAQGTLTFAPGESSQTITVKVNGDTQQESDESFFVQLVSATNAVLGATKSATGTIINEDDPKVIITPVSKLEGNTNFTNFDFAVSLSKATNIPLVYTYNTVDGTAKAGEDYEVTTGTLTFAPNDLNPKTITVKVNGDTTIENDEAFTLALSRSGVFLPETVTTVGTIVNDDSPTLSIIPLDATKNEGNLGTSDFTFAVNLSQPSTQPVTVVYNTADGTAQIASNDYQSIPNSTLTFAANETSKTITVKVNGDTQVEGNETFNVNLSAATGATLATNSAVGTIVNDDSPTLSIIPLDATKNEGNLGTSDFTFAVNLSQPSTQPVTVVYNTADGTAQIASNDYQSIPNSTLTFAANETSKTITVKVNGDTQVEGNETFNVNLSAATGATLATNSAVGTIVNDDSPTLSIIPLDATKNEGNLGTSDFTFAVNLSQPSTQPVTVVYNTADGTAQIASNDYQSIPNSTLTFAANETSKTITVKVNGDTQVEGNETFNVNLSAATGATLATNSAVGTIVNDDSPTLSIIPLDATKNEGNAGTSDFTFAVNLSQPSAQPVTVVYNTADGTAQIASNDYQSIPNSTLTFAANETSKTITVKVNGDTQVEGNETFNVNLSAATGATLATTSAVGTIVNDDVMPPVGDGSRPRERNLDILFRNSRTGDNGVWLLNNTPVTSPVSIKSSTDINWTIVDSVDIDRDGSLDLIWRNYSTGENGIWFMKNATLVKTVTFQTVADVNWRIEGVSDFNSDGKFDLLWRNYQTGENGIWLMDGSKVVNTFALATLTDVKWTIAGVADFNADNNPDILWRNYRTGENAIWSLQGGKFAAGAYLPTLTDLSWTIAGVTDFNNDRSPDILLRNDRTGENALWYMSGNTLKQGRYLPQMIGPNWVIESVADFNNDSSPDILWRNYNTGENVMWYMVNGIYGTSISLPPTTDRTWVIEKTGDFNGDGNVDLLWRNSRTGQVGSWFLNATTVGQTVLLRPERDLGSTIAGTGDFDGDGYNDVIWRNPQTGKNTLWLMKDTTYLGTVNLPDITDPGTTIAGVADFNGDGKLDILWNNGRTGDTFIWVMNGSSFSGRIDLAPPKDLDATIVGIGDFNRDQSVDILWQSPRTGETFLWLMNGTSRGNVISYGFSSDLKWTIEGTGDFNNDNNLDILWRNYRTGETYLWLMNGVTRDKIVNIGTVPDVDWTIEGVGEFNGDTNLDIFWRNARTGETAVWYMNGSELGIGIYGFKIADLDWKVEGIAEFNRVRG